MSLHATRQQKKDLPDFSKMSPEEQERYSREHITEENEERAINEAIAHEAKNDMDVFRSEHVT